MNNKLKNVLFQEYEKEQNFTSKLIETKKELSFISKEDNSFSVKRTHSRILAPVLCTLVAVVAITTGSLLIYRSTLNPSSSSKANAPMEADSLTPQITNQSGYSFDLSDDKSSPTQLSDNTINK